MPEKADRPDSYQVKVLDKAIDILDAFTLQRSELSVAEIVAATGLNRSTAIRLVTNLERRGLIEHAPAKRRYRLGRRILQMGSVVASSFSLREAAGQPIAIFQQESVGTILLAVRNGEHTVIVDRRQGAGGLAMASMPGDVGAVHPLTYGPMGYVVMATMSPDAVEALLDKYPLERRTPYSMMDRGRFLERLPVIRRDGYAMEVNEVVEGVMGMAAPIFDFSGQAVGAISVGFSITRENDTAFLATALTNLRQAAEGISANMGYTGPAEVQPGPEKNEEHHVAATTGGEADG